MPTAIKVSKGLLEQRFDYCSVVWDGLSRQLSEKVKKLQSTRALPELLLNQVMIRTLAQLA